MGAVVSLLLATGVSGQTLNLTLEQRVTAEMAIQRVYYRHQMGATRSFEEAVPRTGLERKVRDYLRQSAALEEFWKTPVTPEMLAAEVQRIQRETRLPERLREVFRELGDDPLIILECFVRPVLVERLSHSFFATDERIHADAKAFAEARREKVMSRVIDPSDEHPLRKVTDGPDAAGLTAITVDGRWTKSSSREDLDARVVEDRIETGPADPGIARNWVPKRSWAEWWQDAGMRYDERSVRALLPLRGAVALTSSPAGVASDPCPEDDTWDNGALDDGFVGMRWYKAVWTGSLMLTFSRSRSGHRYDPMTDTWSRMSTVNSPEAFREHTAVWTGDEMIVWGGERDDPRASVNTGGRYSPATDTWTPTSLPGAPTARQYHTAVWTGTEMIVWGGADASSANLSSGARYDPVRDTWAPVRLPPVLAIPGRLRHTAVWTGREMIVWGGINNTFAHPVLGGGGRYDPASDAWTPFFYGGPEPRLWHSAVWTGREMIVWGGIGASNLLLNSGGRYDPAADLWTPVTETGAPTPRAIHPAIWTGLEMIVWGGEANGGGVTDEEGRYDPVRDVWTPVTRVNAPQLRMDHTLVWTGSLMIVWGGVGYQGNDFVFDGGRYDPASDSWTPVMSPLNIPLTEPGHTLVWTGSHLIAWGGQERLLPGSTVSEGARYDPLTDSWTETSMAGAPVGRSAHTAVWSGDRMIVWGGFSRQWFVFTDLSDGGRYDPLTDSWEPVSLTGAPVERREHAAVWTGNEMIVWGGSNLTGRTSTGGRYDPAKDSWQPLSTDGAPSPRTVPTAVWSGDRMIVWGGRPSSIATSGTGGLYDPVHDTWQPTSLQNAPESRYRHTAVWTGDRMIVWGGRSAASLNTGALYDPVSDSWTSTPLADAPLPRYSHVSVWTGRQMIAWGGQRSDFVATDTGGRYDPTTDGWTPTSTVNVPFTRGLENHLGVWTGSQMIVWGRFGGGRYTAFESPDDDGDGVTVCEGDCDDADPRTSPGAGEICDGKDNDCDGQIPSDEADADADGVSVCEGDCDDADPRARPGLVELPGDLRDEDCDGTLSCPPDGSIPNDGQLVACVARECARLVGEEILTRAECIERIVRAAGRRSAN